MNDVPNFNSTEEVLSWLQQFQAKHDLNTSDSSKKIDAPPLETPNAPKRAGKRRKIHSGELLSVAKAILDMLDNYDQFELDDFFNPVELDEHRRRLGPECIEEQIYKASMDARSGVLRFILDIIDFFTGSISVPSVKPSVVFWTRKAIAAYISGNPNTILEAPPWKGLPRNVIAAEILKSVEDAWFKGGSQLGEFARNEAARIFESSNYVYAEFQKYTWGY